MKLSPKQSEVLRLIKRYHRSHGHAPTLGEIAELQGVRIPTVYQHFLALIKKGALRRGEAGTSRTWVPTDFITHQEDKDGRTTGDGAGAEAV